MNKKDIQGLKGFLLQEKDRLEAELADIESGNHDKDASGGSVEGAYRTHMADTATDTFERARDLTLEENVREMLRNVTAALAKIEAGTYGTCEVCREAIALERLKALPYADMCIDCKKKEEAW